MKEWRAEASQIIKAKAEQAKWTKVEAGVAVTVVLRFGIKPPAKLVRSLPTTKPDLDKLARTCLDAVSQAGNVWADDNQVIILSCAKYYELEPTTIIEVSVDYELS